MIGKNIRKIRESKKMTQEEFAQKLYVTRQTISNYENGRSKPDIEMLMKIASVLETDIHHILYGIPKTANQKNAIKRFLIGLVIFIFLLIVTIPFYSFDPYRDQNWIYLVYFGKLFYFPCLMMILGWTIMQAVSCITSLMPIEKSWVKICRMLLLIILGIWCIFLFSAPLIKTHFYSMTILTLILNYEFGLILFLFIGILCWLLNIPKLNGSK